jgi:rsbT antagonist protein RsbS
MDISSVETLDSFFARTVAETAQMVALMGGRTIIAGMRPAVAVTATQIGLTFGKIETALNVGRALDLVANKPLRDQQP